MTHIHGHMRWDQLQNSYQASGIKWLYLMMLGPAGFRRMWMVWQRRSLQPQVNWSFTYPLLIIYFSFNLSFTIKITLLRCCHPSISMVAIMLISIITIIVIIMILLTLVSNMTQTMTLIMSTKNIDNRTDDDAINKISDEMVDVYNHGNNRNYYEISSDDDNDDELMITLDSTGDHFTTGDIVIGCIAHASPRYDTRSFMGQMACVKLWNITRDLNNFGSDPEAFLCPDIA